MGLIIKEKVGKQIERINTLNLYLKKYFGEKIYKVSLDGGFTCPNRDGKISNRGCVFCSEYGSGEFAGSRSKTITEQIDDGIKLLSNKFTGKVIAYFQNFTNTYGDIDYLRKIYFEALRHPQVVGIAIATRPDCIDENVLELLSQINKKYFLWIELGLQTINERVAKIINRGYNLSVYDEICEKLNKHNIKFVTHIIVGLPYENEDDALFTAIHSEKMGSWGIKIHLLHIVKNTQLAKMYEKNLFKIQEKDEYVKKVVKILQNISYNIVVHRMTGDGDKKTLIAPLWSTNKRWVLNSIHKYMKNFNIIQGDKREGICD